ncbi:hypothetical protein P7K49_005626 [Saguinus oedipus]|uniref:Uncharacterized protein n=1 Tax=Saguinus oedipus TaxID=9490 RepID=A0ABQ9W039_SAGOE|nr:hypothetical protein P7K49_005626 [Saguinus oedipus]
MVEKFLDPESCYCSFLSNVASLTAHGQTAVKEETKERLQERESDQESKMAEAVIEQESIPVLAAPLRGAETLELALLGHRSSPQDLSGMTIFSTVLTVKESSVG